MVAKWIRLWLKRKPLLTGDEPVPAPAPTPQRRPPLLATADNPLLLDKATIARVTGGTWHNVPDDALITGISFNRRYLAEGTSGNLYFALNADATDERFDAKNAESVRKALARGAVAAVVPNGAQGLPDTLPLLRVEHMLTALDHLGFYVRDHLFAGKRVLVSGTEGKTGFKNMLRHVLAPQISTHAITNSSNLDFSIFASLASIRAHDRIEIVEAAGTHPGRLARRSEYVRPHMFVLTEVGNEHLNYHGSQQAVIDSKADIVTGLVDGGYGLLNADSENCAAVRKAVLARRRVPLLLFGSTAACNGRLLERRFEKDCWIVAADIEGQRVEYRLPVLGEHAPLASVSVLLAAYYLGADVRQAAADLVDFVPYESQGVLRRIAHRGGELLYYDNASRASVLSYRSTLRTAARLTPPAPHGRKVAVIGQMIFLGEESETWHASLAEWVDDAGFDRVILVGKYADVTYAHLRRPDVVIRRFPDYDRRHSGREELQALIDAILETCEPGDLLFVKGELDELGEHLRRFEVDAAAAPSPAPAVSPPPTDLSALAGLRPLSLDDLPRYRAAIDQTRRTVWQHYFPFIYLLGQSRGSQFLVEEDAGSFCLYYLRQKGHEQHLSLFVLPMPLQTAVVERCIERIKAFNRSDRASLFRVDADDVALFRGRANTRIVACPEEYVYAPANYLDLSGGKKGKLRREINSIARLEGLEILDYQTAFAAECKGVLERWAALQEEKYGNVRYESFTIACLEQYDWFPRADLFGKVLRVNGDIRSFGFGGEMRRGMGNIFIAYSDLHIHGLSRFMNYTLLRGMEHLELANASHAGEPPTPGLASAKQALGPAFMHRPYQVYAG
jgi:UDP-N-acetylmuramoyl-tripeptide--D-alanyl-D-alanine ligase